MKKKILAAGVIVALIITAVLGANLISYNKFNKAINLPQDDYTISIKQYSSGKSVSVIAEEDKQLILASIRNAQWGGRAMIYSSVSPEDNAYSITVTSSTLHEVFTVAENNKRLNYVTADPINQKIKNSDDIFNSVSAVFKKQTASK